MINYRYPGKTIDWINDTGAAVAAGAVVVIGLFVGVACSAIASLATGAVAVSEVFKLPKKNEAFSVGDVVYWDADGDPYGGTAGTGALTAIEADGDAIAGVVTLDAGATAATAEVKLMPMFAPSMPAVDVPLLSAIEADGTLLAAFADGASTTPGIDVVDSVAVGIRWNNHATPDPITLSAPIPAGRKTTGDLTVHILASKTGATEADAVTFDVGAYFVTAGALHDADADCGDTSDAMVGDADAKTVQEVTVTIDADDVPAAASVLVMTIQPTDGTLGTDDVVIHRVWID